MEGNVLLNDTFNIFYLCLYGIRRMVKGYSDSKRGNHLFFHNKVYTSSKGFQGDPQSCGARQTKNCSF